jgi:hypothetical protein
MKKKDLPPQLTPAKQQEDLEYKVRINELQSQLDPGKLVRFTSAAGAVAAAVDSGANVINAVTSLSIAVKTLYSTYEGTKEFGERHRSLELIVVNATRRRLIWQESIFNSGTTFAGPMPMNVLPVDTIDPTGATLWTVANGQGSLLTGVSGGGKWRLEGTPFSLVLGFTNPQFGSIKSEIGLVSCDARADLAYNACANLEAKHYEMLGYTLSVYADEARAGGDRRLVFCISENPQKSSYCMGDLLKPGEYLAPDQYLLSRNSRFAACYHSNRSNLVVYDLEKLHAPAWSTPPNKNAASRCGVSNAGNFSIRGISDDIHWEAPRTAPGGYLKLCDDGSLQMYSSNNDSIWNSHAS